MHASRHRSSPGNGYRSNSAGMGLAPSRISPEDSLRGHSPGYRNFNRSFGRGQLKSFHQPPQLSRRGDVFMEAGRLAAEYLVSQGLLPASALSCALKKKHVGNFQELKPKEGGGLHVAQEGGRTSALARLGNVVPDAVSGRRRFPDEYISTGPRSHGKGRRNLFSGSHSSTWSRENGRSGSWSDKAVGSLDMDSDVDNASAFDEEQRVHKNVAGGFSESSPIPNETVPKSDDAGDSGLKSVIYQLPDAMDSEASGTTDKGLPIGTDADLSNMTDVSRTLNTGTGEVKEGTGNDDTEKQRTTGDLHLQHSAVVGDCELENSADLLKLCRFVNIPKRTRSSLMHKGSKVDKLPITEVGSTPDAIPPKVSVVSTENDSVDGSSGITFSNPTHSSKCPESDISKTLSVQSMDDIEELKRTYSAEQSKCSRSHSFPDGSSLYKQEAVQGPPGFGKCTSMVKERGEKRAALHDDARGETKKPREWLSSVVTLDNEFINLSNSSLKEPISQKESTLHCDEGVEVGDHDTLASIVPFSIGSDRPCIDYAEEKECFPSSFKICDLNLMETSDMNENRDSDPILIYPSISETKKECPSVGIELSMSNGCNKSDEHMKRAANVGEVEVIDLEDDPIQEDRAFSNSEKREESAFTSLEGFSSNLQSSNDINVQNGYGLMSDLLGTDITSSSSAPADINSLHNEMDLHNGEGILGDDDSIYMSLEEIPISFLQSWEQPTQDYGKPF